MNMNESVIEGIRKIDRGLATPVMISHDEVDRLMVNRLIQVRNSNVNDGRDMSFFDKTIRWFLSADEFEKYVIGNKVIKF